MNGEIALEAVYGERLAVIQPSRADVEALARAYRDNLAQGAADAIATLGDAGLRVVLVSGGLRQAIAPLAADLGVELHAVDVRWNAAGEYSDFDAASPLTTQHGKVDVVRGLALPGPVLATGDGATDLAMREAVDTFVAFTGFVTRENVVRESDGAVATFAELAALALGQASS